MAATPSDRRMETVDPPMEDLRVGPFAGPGAEHPLEDAPPGGEGGGGHTAAVVGAAVEVRLFLRGRGYSRGDGWDALEHAESRLEQGGITWGRHRAIQRSASFRHHPTQSAVILICVDAFVSVRLTCNCVAHSQPNPSPVPRRRG